MAQEVGGGGEGGILQTCTRVPLWSQPSGGPRGLGLGMPDRGLGMPNYSEFQTSTSVCSHFGLSSRYLR